MRHGINVVKTTSDHPVYRQALSIRANAYGQDINSARDETDAGSEVYCFFVRGIPTGTIRLTLLTRRSFDCQDHYPASLLERFRTQIATVGNCAVLPGTSAEFNLAKVMFATLWHDKLPAGFRVVVMNAHERGVSYYQRLGLKLVKNSRFVHPKLHTPSYVLVMSADPNAGTALDGCFEQIADPVTVVDLAEVISIEHGRFRRRSKTSSLQR